MVSLKAVSTDYNVELRGSPMEEDRVLNTMDSDSLFIVLHHNEKAQRALDDRKRLLNIHNCIVLFVFTSFPFMFCVGFVNG